MLKRNPIFLSVFVFCLAVFGHVQKSESVSANQSKYLTNRIDESDKRYASFLFALEMLKDHTAKILVETGTSRDGDRNFCGDGGSTNIFGDWASHNHAILFTVDISPDAIANSRQSTQAYQKSINFFCMDSVKFLEEFDRPIDFLYLDSFDFDYNNPTPSQEHHLFEIKAAMSKLHANSIVMIDDCDLPYGGKGKLVIDFLKEKGWKIIHQGYQVILILPPKE